MSIVLSQKDTYGIMFIKHLDVVIAKQNARDGFQKYIYVDELGDRIKLEYITATNFS